MGVTGGIKKDVVRFEIPESSEMQKGGMFSRPLSPCVPREGGVPVNDALFAEVVQRRGELCYPETYDVLLQPPQSVQMDCWKWRCKGLSECMR